MNKEEHIKDLKEKMPEGVYRTDGVGWGCRYCGSYGLNNTHAQKHDCEKTKKRVAKLATNIGSIVGGGRQGRTTKFASLKYRHK